jgi:transcriptional regulator with XRE-family HTH domain
MNDTDVVSWFRRVEGLRKRAGLSMEQLAESLGVSRPTLYAWKSGSQPGSEAVDRLAAFLGEAPEALAAEMGMLAVPSVAQRLDAMATRSFNAALVREHIGGLARALQLVAAGDPDHLGRPTGYATVDVVTALLRAGLIKHRIDAMLAIRAEYRGSRHRRLFQWQVCVVPAQGQPDTTDAINDTLKGQLLDIYLERSRALWPAEFRDRDNVAVLLVPELHAVRLVDANSAAAPAVSYQSDTLVLSLAWGGAQDVGALLAHRFGHSQVHCEGLARSNLSLGPWAGTESHLRDEIRAVLDHAFDDAPRARLPIVWTQSDPDALYDEDELPSSGRTFRGRVVVLKLDKGGLRYAADRYQALALDESGSWRRVGTAQRQARVLAAARAVAADPDAVVEIDVQTPAGLRRTNGHYRDEVDRWFDAYADAAEAAARVLADTRSA